jgi:hypothetical protein
MNNKKREAAAERKRQQRARDKARHEKLGMANTVVNLSDGERRMWAVNARARGFVDQDEYFMALVMTDRRLLEAEGCDLSHFEELAQCDKSQ